MNDVQTSTEQSPQARDLLDDVIDQRDGLLADADRVVKQVDALTRDYREAVDLLNGMVGLIQIIQTQRPDLLVNHRYVDAIAWLTRFEKHSGSLGTGTGDA